MDGGRTADLVGREGRANSLSASGRDDEDDSHG